MELHPGLISTARQIAGLVEAIRKTTNEPGKAVVAFDTEFIRESTFYPIVEIIQIATDSESWLVDAQAFKKNHRPGPQGGFDPGIQPLLDLFQDRSILKIAHAAQGDQECLYTSFGIVADPIFDTSMGASLCGFGDNIGLGKLLKSALDVTIEKGHARTNWSVRPLPEQLMKYAHADVTHLVELGLRLLERLERDQRKQWALDLSAKYNDLTLYEADVEGLAHKLARGGRLDRKGYAALVELVKWREKRVRQLNLPRRWVADDAVLVDIAQVRPKDLDHLGTFRGLNKGEIKASGEQILQAIAQSVEQAPALNPPGRERHAAPSAEESQALELLKCYVGILADRHRVAAKHLSTVSQLMPLLRAKIERPEDLVSEGVLSAEAARLIGEELIEFLKGKRALVVRAAKIEVIDL